MQNKEVTSGDLTTKSLKAVTQERVSGGTESRGSQGINYEKAAGEAINNVTQDLAPKKIEQRLKQGLERDILGCKTKTRLGNPPMLRRLGEDHEYTSICINV